MSIAEKVMAQAKGHSVIRVAKREDAKVEIDRQDGMIFYRFSDRSILGTKGRARSHQMWTIPPSES